MKTSIVVECYRKLSRIELNKLTLFINSPYFNQHEPTRKLHDYLVHLHPEFPEEPSKKELIFQQIFGDIPFHSGKMKDCNFRLLSLFQEFIVAEKIKDNQFQFREIEIESLLEKGMERLAKKVLNKSISSLKTASEQLNSSAYFHHQSLINGYYYNYEEIFGDRLKSPHYLQAHTNALDQYYLSKKLMQGARMLNRTKVLQTQFDMPFFKEIEAFLDDGQNGLTKSEALEIHLVLYQLLKEENEDKYFELKEKLTKTTLEKSEQKLFYSFLRNDCIRRINKGNNAFLEELFELNLAVIEQGILLENKQLSEWTYKNFISVGLRLKRFEWTEKFINKYSQYLDPDIYDNAYNYNLSNLYYFQKRYKKAIQLLLQIEYTDVFYMISSKAILLKIYYEEKEWDALNHFLHSFRLMTMRQKKVSGRQKNAYLQLIKITGALAKLNEKKATFSKERYKEEVEKIGIKIEGSKALANKTWIIEKWKELNP